MISESVVKRYEQSWKTFVKTGVLQNILTIKNAKDFRMTFFAGALSGQRYGDRIADKLLEIPHDKELHGGRSYKETGAIAGCHRCEFLEVITIARERVESVPETFCGLPVAEAVDIIMKHKASVP